MFSKACEYGIRATLYVAQQSRQGQRAKLAEIARATDSPVAFTAKILQQLARAGVISSVVGPGGGFEVDPSRGLTLSDIVDAIDGDRIYRGCGLGLPSCDEARPCPVHDRFKEVRDQLREMLQTTTVQELATGLEAGISRLRH